MKGLSICWTLQYLVRCEGSLYLLDSTWLGVKGLSICWTSSYIFSSFLSLTYTKKLLDRVEFEFKYEIVLIGAILDVHSVFRPEDLKSSASFIARAELYFRHSGTTANLNLIRLSLRKINS